MATVTRYNGDSDGVPNMDIAYKGSAYVAGTPVQTGLGKKLTGYKIVQAGVDLATAEFGVGGAVDAILRVIAQNGTVVAYQGETGAGGQLSVLVEGGSWASDTAIRDAIRALTSVGVGPISMATCTCVSTGGLKLG